MTRAVTRTWYRVAVSRGGAPSVVAAGGEHLGVAVAAAERHVRGAFAVAAEVADESQIPLGESLGKSALVEVGDAADVPVFRWPVGVLPTLTGGAAAGAARRGWIARSSAASRGVGAPTALPAGRGATPPVGSIARPDPQLSVIEAQTTADHLTDLFLGLIERLPSADNLEVRLLDHFESAGRADVWLTSRVDARRILRLLDDHDEELLGNGHLELSVYLRAQRATLRLTEHKTVVWLAGDDALDADVQRWLGELSVPEVDSLVTIQDVPHFHYRPARSRDRKRLGDELYRERLRRVDTLRPISHGRRTRDTAG